MDITEEYQNEEFNLWVNPDEFTTTEPGDVFELNFGSPEKTAKELRKQLQINQYNKEASIVKISLESPNQLKSKAIIRLMMQSYINRELLLKNEKAKRTVEFIDKQLSGIQSALNEAETEMVDFRTENSLINISQEGEALYTKIQELEKQAQETDLKFEYYQYLQKYLNQPVNNESVVSPSTVGITDPPLINSIVQYNELKNQLTITDSYASDINPQVQSIKSQMISVKSIISENINNLINATQLTQSNLKRQIQQAEHELDQLPSSERKLINIQRQFNLNDNLYVYLLEKKAEASIALASTVASTEILDEPLLEARTRPKNLKNYLLALAFGLFIPFGFIILKEFFTNTIQDSTEIEKQTSLPILSSIALSHKDKELVMSHFPRSRTSESFRNMRASLKYLMPENKNTHAIMFTSFTSGDGKTFCAMNTAVMMAQAGYQTILLGLDLRRPKIYDTFKLENSRGISNLLLSNEKNETDDFIYDSNIENLKIILSGPTPPLPNELFMRDSFHKLMKDLSQNYEFIIIDTPPIGLVSDAYEISKYADTTLFVIRHQLTPKKSIDFLKDIQSKNLINNLGILYNGVDYHKLTSYYGYNNKKYNAYYED
ncbi:GumC family protein [Marinoscillum pacificum]|uniref:GumC family protein n=1 Tax=Marinoscillum pacificum TaxID=392723 RepID=UPI0021573CC8|nr:tyrosine-protein kinase [Marinoscillum pacificum]